MKSIEAPHDQDEGDGFSHRLMKLWIQEQLEIAQGVQCKSIPFYAKDKDFAPE